MARVLIVGCGCRGRGLASELAAGGHAVRGTTRDPGAAAAIAGAGAEPFVGDPDRIGMLMPALDAVTIVCWLLGSARGEPAALSALHGARLDFFLQRCVDTTVRGFVYEASGSAGAQRLQAGCELVREAGARWEIPYALIGADPGDPQAWAGDALAAIHGLLAL